MATPDPSPDHAPEPVPVEQLSPVERDPVELPDAATREYGALLAEARTLYPGVRIGRPGRSRTYWATIAAMRLLRARWAVDIEGADQVSPGPAIMIGNHVHFMDPVCVVMTEWWRVSAFTKLEWFEHRGSLFFRLMGQIPLRRGDARSTEWAMQMSRYALGDGGRIGLYPEGTRSPDPAQLHKLHKRIMIPLLQANPDVPVHVVTSQYENHPAPRRIQVKVRISQRLPLDPRTMDADELTGTIRDALLALGGQTYVDSYAQDIKAEKHRLRGRSHPGEES
jgi:1-acyl-sn-glycerol-3-phosphate acyltransferase